MRLTLARQLSLSFRAVATQDPIQIALNTCSELGFPVAWHKLEGPSTIIQFLGLELDSDHGLIHLPAGKLCRIQAQVRRWLGRRSCTKRELLSLIGSLHNAATVVKPGHVFLRRLIDLSSSVKHLHYRVRLNKEAFADLHWWDTFMTDWNGSPMLQTLGRAVPSVIVRFDASGTWGVAQCGQANGYSGSGTTHGALFLLRKRVSTASSGRSSLGKRVARAAGSIRMRQLYRGRGARATYQPRTASDALATSAILRINLFFVYVAGG